MGETVCNYLNPALRMELTLLLGSYVGTPNIFLPEALHNHHLMLVLGMINGTLLDQFSGAKEVETPPISIL